MRRRAICGIVAASAAYNSASGPGVPSLEWSVHSGDSISSTSKTVTIPSSVAVGHFMVAVVLARQPVTVSSGWTIAGTSGAVGGQVLRIYTKVSTEAGIGQSFTVTNTSGSSRLDCCILGFSYTGGVTPYIDQFTTGTTTTSTTLNYPNPITISTRGVPVFASHIFLRNFAGATPFDARGSTDGSTYSSMALTYGYTELFPPPSSGVSPVDGARVGVHVLVDAVAPSYLLHFRLNSEVSGQGLGVAAFVVTCGKTT